MIQVYAPASIGNIGVGFDTLGMAITPIDNSLLGDTVTIIKDSDEFILQNSGCFCKQLPVQLEKNIVFQCWKKFCEVVGKQYPMSIRLEKNVPISSGLGSSACSIVASLMAINAYCKYPLDNNQLLMLMGEVEGEVSGSAHFDNVAPCFLGGIQLILPKFKIISQKIPFFSHWMWIVAYPGIAVSTIASRSVLPVKYSRKDCIIHGQCLSGFIHACYTNEEDLAIRCMKDVIAEPYRSQLLPVDISFIRNILIKKGAVSCGISGSGPTIFAVCNTEVATQGICDWLSDIYLKNISGFVKICVLNKCGACIITE